MPEKPLTAKQRHWLHHVKAADASDGTLFDYASAHNLNLKALYQWKTKLIKLARYPSASSGPDFVAVRSRPLPAQSQCNCSVMLYNGTRIEFTGALDSKAIRSIITSAGLRR